MTQMRSHTSSNATNKFCNEVGWGSYPRLSSTAWMKLGLVLVGIGLVQVIIPTRVMAQPPNQSDITGTNTFGDSSVRFGFEALAKSGLVTPLLQSVQTSITALLNGDITSASTKVSLTTLSQRLNTMNSKLWDGKGSLDGTIRAIATDLSKDLADANTACLAGDANACRRLAELTTQIDGFLENLETLRNALVKHAQVSRTF